MRFRWGTRGQNINYERFRQIKSLLALFIAAWPLGVNDWVSGPPLWSSVLGWQRLNQDKSKIKTHSAPKKTFYSFVKTNFYRCKPWTIKHGCSLCDITHRFLKSLCQDSSVVINGEISYRGQKCFLYWTVNMFISSAKFGILIWSSMGVGHLRNCRFWHFHGGFISRGCRLMQIHSQIHMHARIYSMHTHMLHVERNVLSN